MRKKMIWKKIAAMAMTAIMAVSLTACGSDAGSSTGSDSGDKTLDVIAWSSLFTDAQCQAIKEATGITLNVTPFNTLEELYTKLNSGGVDYDMCVTGDYMAATLIKAGLVQKLDKTALKESYDDLDDAFKNPSYDKNLDYCMPEGGGTVGILVNRDKIKNEIKSWDDLFDSSLKGQIVMLDDQRIILGLGNVLNGKEFNSTNEADIQAAKATMEKIIPNVKLFQSFDQYDSMANGEANIMVGWSYEAYKNVSENKGNWEYIYPEEGMHCYVDNYCICKTTDNVDLCNKLINYICGADFNKVVWKENPGTRIASKKFAATLDLDELGKKIVYPPTEQYNKGLYLTVLDDSAMGLYDTAWTEFKQKASIQ